MTEKKPSTSPWARGDGPLPENDHDLIAEIKALAAARRNDALKHLPGCQCDGCKIRRKHHNAHHQRAA
jgi:hypothetical protein